MPPKRPRAAEAAAPAGGKKAKAAAKPAKPAGAKKPKAEKAPAAAAAAAAPPAAAPPSSSRLDAPTVARAVQALATHLERESGGRKALLAGEAPINVLIATKTMPKALGKAAACKPVQLRLPHPYRTLESAEVCLITKDPQREFKDKLAELGHGRVKVIGVTKLKKKYHPFEAKRELCASYDVFLADARVLPMLPPMLGKTFFEKKKLPCAVDLTKKGDGLKGELERAASACLYRHASGTSNAIQVGTAAQKVPELVANVTAAVEQAVAKIPKGWSNVLSLHLRSTNSVALPFYNSLPHAD